MILPGPGPPEAGRLRPPAAKARNFGIGQGPLPMAADPAKGQA